MNLGSSSGVRQAYCTRSASSDFSRFSQIQGDCAAVAATGHVKSNEPSVVQIPIAPSPLGIPGVEERVRVGDLLTAAVTREGLEALSSHKTRSKKSFALRSVHGHQYGGAMRDTTIMTIPLTRQIPHIFGAAADV